MTQFKVQGLAVTLSEGTDAQELSFELPSTLKCFEGHFPGNPMLPAYATIEISLALGRELKLLPSILKKIPHAKFLAALKPGDLIKVLVRKDASSVDFEWQQKQNNEWKKACDLSVAFH